MIRYKYSSARTPPAPFVHLLLRNPQSEKKLEQIPAQVDSAADRTVIPRAIVDQLGLQPLRELMVEGLGGSVHSMPTCLVDIGLHDLVPVTIEALASREEPVVLLGRDVLNGFRFFLLGPELALEIR